MNTKIKRLLALLLAMTLVFSFAACKGDEKQDDATDAIADGNSSEEASIESGSDLISDIISGETSVDESESEADNSSSAVVDKGDLPVIGEYEDTDADGNSKRDPNYKSVNYEVMRGIWLSQFDMESLYQSGGGQKPAENFERMCGKVCAGIADAGFNTIIVQVRPNGDSFYPSEFYCPSAYVVGAYGMDFDYDMLRIFVKCAHEYGLSFHAWVNPMRLMRSSEIDDVSADYPIAQWFADEAEKKEHLAEYNGYYYLVPGIEENQQLVWNGVTELCRNYNIDAVHIDDYFYPTTDESFDRDHFLTKCEEFGGDNAIGLRLYRLEMVNTLVKGMYSAVKAVDPTLWFGISPAGSINNNLSSLYAEVTSWCKGGNYCDYIVPQVYWGFEHPTDSCKFDKCSEEWESYCLKDSTVRLVIGVGIYRIGSTESEFAEYREHNDVTKRQLEFLETMEKNDGFVFYTYGTMFNLQGKLSGIVKERKNFLPVLKEFGGEDAYTVVE